MLNKWTKKLHKWKPIELTEVGVNLTNLLTVLTVMKHKLLRFTFVNIACHRIWEMLHWDIQTHIEQLTHNDDDE